MNLELQEISLDINDNKTYEYLYTKQHDQGRELIINITKDGQPFDISNATIIINIKKPDNTVILDNCEVIDINKIKVVVTEQISVLSGRLPFEIQIIEGLAIIKTITGYIKVEESVVDKDYVVSSDEFNALNDALIKVYADYELIVEESQRYANLAGQSAENASLSETNAKTSEENAKVSEENAALSETNAATSEENAESFANTAKSYAVGEGNVREDESTDNARFYYEKTKAFAESCTNELISETELTNQEIGDFWLQPY